MVSLGCSGCKEQRRNEVPRGHVGTVREHRMTSLVAQAFLYQCLNCSLAGPASHPAPSGGASSAPTLASPGPMTLGLPFKPLERQTLSVRHTFWLQEAQALSGHLRNPFWGWGSHGLELGRAQKPRQPSAHSTLLHFHLPVALVGRSPDPQRECSDRLSSPLLSLSPQH